MATPPPLDEVVELELRLLDPSIRARRDEVGRLLHAHRTSFRSSLWVKADDAWKVLFHQGTPVRAPDLDG